jgi:hypothetical protein
VGENMISVRGVIVPVKWDERGNVIAVAISTHDEDEYLIDDRERGGELKAFIREEVEVVGRLREEEESKTMTVTRYSLKKVLDQMSFR